MFIELDRLRSATSEASPVARDTVLAELEKAVTRFFDEYETFVNSYSAAHAISLLVASAHLDGSELPEDNAVFGWRHQNNFELDVR